MAAKKQQKIYKKYRKIAANEEKQFCTPNERKLQAGKAAKAQGRPGSAAAMQTSNATEGNRLEKSIIEIYKEPAGTSSNRSRRRISRSS